MGRSVTVLDDAVKGILEAQFQLRFTKSRACSKWWKSAEKIMPTLMVPAIHEVNNWLCGRLAIDMKPKQSGSNVTQKQRAKSL
jgi:hypothetical protein